MSDTPAERVKRIQDEISGVASQYGVSSWERGFLESVKERHFLTAKQEEVMRSIEHKVFVKGPAE